MPAARPTKLARPGEGHRVAAQGDLHAAEPRQLDEVAVVHARERQRICALGRHLLCDVLVTHAWSPLTLMCKSRKSAAGTGAGAPSNSARAAVVFGKAITSRSEPAFGELHRDAVEAERDAAVRRRAGPKPFEQEAEARLRRGVVDAEQPKMRDCNAGSLMRMLPPPSSVPLSTRSYACARTRSGADVEQRQVVRHGRRERMMHGSQRAGRADRARTAESR